MDLPPCVIADTHGGFLRRVVPEEAVQFLATEKEMPQRTIWAQQAAAY